MILGITLEAQEPTVALLKHIESNSNQKFSFKNYTFTCTAYAITPLNEIANRESLSTLCKTALDSFYRADPKAKYFALYALSVEEMYHLEFRDRGCLLFANGEITLSEMLLREGLALLIPNFKDKEYRYLYEKAQAKAKREKKGVWGERLQRDCSGDIYKK